MRAMKDVDYYRNPQNFRHPVYGMWKWQERSRVKLLDDAMADSWVGRVVGIIFVTFLVAFVIGMFFVKVVPRHDIAAVFGVICVVAAGGGPVFGIFAWSRERPRIRKAHPEWFELPEALTHLPPEATKRPTGKVVLMSILGGLIVLTILYLLIS